MMPQYKKSTGQPLMVNGVPMGDCCCDDPSVARCQWAVDFEFFCVGTCDGGAWVEGQIPCCVSDSSDPNHYDWIDNRAYAVGYPAVQGGKWWVCIEAHTVPLGGAFDASKWSNYSLWKQKAAPFCIGYAVGQPAVLPGLVYDSLGRCTARRYGPIHPNETCTGGYCSTTIVPDVDLSLPGLDESTLCGPEPASKVISSGAVAFGCGACGNCNYLPSTPNAAYPAGPCSYSVSMGLPIMQRLQADYAGFPYPCESFSDINNIAGGLVGGIVLKHMCIPGRAAYQASGYYEGAFWYVILSYNFAASLWSLSGYQNWYRLNPFPGAWVGAFNAGAHWNGPCNDASAVFEVTSTFMNDCPGPFITGGTVARA